LRKVCLTAALAAASLVCAAVALAQTSNNVYKVTGRIAKGGSKAAPKHVGIVFDYTVGTSDGTLSAPVKTYKLHFEGLRFDTTKVAKGKYCSAAAINAAASDAACPKATHIGTGKVKSLVGVAGQPLSTGARCDLDLDIYAGGPKRLALYLHGMPPSCIATITQAIDAKLSTDATGGSLTYTVPPTLLHPVSGLDASLTSVASTIVKGAGTSGPFTSIGCDGSRTITATFSEEAGGTGTATTSAGTC
jgi:hypothetical protein